MRTALLRVLGSVVASTGPAAACPLCSSDTAVQVRALAFGPDFLSHLAATLAPVPLLVALVAIGGRWLARLGRR